LLIYRPAQSVYIVMKDTIKGLSMWSKRQNAMARPRPRPWAWGQGLYLDREQSRDQERQLLSSRILEAKACIRVYLTVATCNITLAVLLIAFSVEVFVLSYNFLNVNQPTASTIEKSPVSTLDSTHQPCDKQPTDHS